MKMQAGMSEFILMTVGVAALGLRAVLPGFESQLPFFFQDHAGTKGEYTFDQKSARMLIVTVAGIKPALTISSRSSSVRLGSAAFTRIGGRPAFCTAGVDFFPA
jgi:hypothetical protein